MKPIPNTTPEDEEIHAPVDKRPKSTGFLPVTAGSNPAGSTLSIISRLSRLGSMVLVAWGQAIAPSCRRAKHRF